jgi:chromosome segregation ATPase
MKSEKSFRRNLFGGFNARDVVKYLAQVSKERREETEALRAGADKLRKERDELLVQLEGNSLPPTAAADAAERDELRLQFYEMRKERDELQDKLEKLTAQRENEIASSEEYRRERAAFESDRSAMLDALTRREEETAELANERAKWGAERAGLLEERQKLLMERGSHIGEAARLKQELENAGMSRERREREEREAAQRVENARAHADNIRTETARLITETRARFAEMAEKSRVSSLEVVLELDRMRGFFTKFPERFAEPEQILSQLEGDPRPRIREFVPPRIEDA